MARASTTELPAGWSGVRRRWSAGVKRFARRKPLGFFGAVILLVLVTAAIFAPFIAPDNPLVIDIPNRLQNPTWSHPFGTDQIGRDTFSRIVFGTRVSLIVGFGGMAITLFISIIIGTVSGYFKGNVDMVLQRFVDAFMALPVMVVLLEAVFFLGNSLLNVTLVLGVISAPAASRIIRGSTIAVMTNQYIEGARALGASDVRIIARHVLPNIAAPILVIGSIYVGGNILAEAALSFLGLGVPPPDPSWGNMLTVDGVGTLPDNPWLAFFPGMAITTAVFALNVLGDALRDELDPSRRGA